MSPFLVTVLLAPEPAYDTGMSIESPGKERMIREQGHPCCKPLQVVLNDVVERLDRSYQQPEAERLSGYSTGLSELDSLTLGLRPGELVVVAGRPMMGKMSLATHLCLQMAGRQRQTVGVASLYTTPASWVLRMLSMTTGVGTYALRTGQLSEADWPRITQGLKDLQEASCSFLDSAFADPIALFQGVRRLAWDSGGLGLLIVDRLQYLLSPQSLSGDVSDFASRLKALALELHCPVLLLSTLPFPKRRKRLRPLLQDFKYQWGLVEYADLVLLLYREECYNPDTPDKGTMECIVTHNRNGGGLGTVRLGFAPVCGQLWDYEIGRGAWGDDGK